MRRRGECGGRGAGGKQQDIRYGPGVAELWSGLVLWSDARSARSFSVVVTDEKDLKDYMLPKFEILVFGALHVDQPGISCLYELHALDVENLIT